MTLTREVGMMQPFIIYTTERGQNVICTSQTGDDSCLCPFVQPPRACDNYWSEFRHCKSLWNRFHHYYTYGTSPSCQQWQEDYNNCKEWEKHRDIEAKVLYICMRSRCLSFSDTKNVGALQSYACQWEISLVVNLRSAVDFIFLLISKLNLVIFCF